MNRKSLSLSAAAAVSLVAPMAQAFTVVPANYVSGVVNAIDVKRATVTIDGTAYAATAALLTDVMPGGEVTLTMLAVGGRYKAIALDHVANEIEPAIMFGGEE
jgi:hypothetical protein